MESTYCGTDQGPYKVDLYCNLVISIENYTVLKVLMKNGTRIWRIAYNHGIINIPSKTSEIFH